jgi:hypothetical protein
MFPDGTGIAVELFLIRYFYYSNGSDSWGAEFRSQNERASDVIGGLVGVVKGEAAGVDILFAGYSGF